MAHSWRSLVAKVIVIGLIVPQIPSASAAFTARPLKGSNESDIISSRALLGATPSASVPVRLPVPAGEDYVEWRQEARYNSALEENCNRDRNRYLGVHKSQSMEDVWLFERLFYGMKGGVIVESGALDGVQFSNSMMFEVAAGWTAVHVEGDPESYRNLVKNRPAAVNVHAALCSEPTMLHYLHGHNPATRGFYEFMPKAFLEKWHPEIAQNPSRVEGLPTVQCLPAKKLFGMLNLKHIDIWVLDVEGAEESVLQGTDFNAVHINAVAMECDRKDKEKDQRKMDILESNGFTCELVVRNCMCKHKDFTDIHVAPVLSAEYARY